MVWIFNDGSGSTVNITVASFSALMYRFKELLKTAGWTHEASSDGTNVSNTSGNANDQIGSSGEMATNNAWWVGSDPNGRTWIFRRGSADANWMVVYVPLDSSGVKQVKTANGTTSAVPTYTTSKVLIGTLPDTAAAWSVGAGNRWAIGADNHHPYGVYMFGWSAIPAIGSQGGMFVVDPLERGTYDPLDQDPYVFHVRGTGGNGFAQAGLSGDTAGPSAYYRKGLTGEFWGFTPAMIPCVLQGGSTLVSCVGNLAKNPYHPRTDDGLPVWYCRRGQQSSSGQQAAGIKGMSSMLRWIACSYPIGYLLTSKEAGDRFVADRVTVPWPTGVGVNY